MTTLDHVMQPVDSGHLDLDEAVSHTTQGPSQVQFVYPDTSTEELMRIAEVSGVTSFWDDPKEDIYTMDHGDPV